MAGDWLKVETSTPSKPEVFALAELLALERDEIVGKLIRVWAWFDLHLASSNASSVTDMTLDEVAGRDGFAEALVKVGWLHRVEGGFDVPHFERHLGKGAKNRALTAERQRSFRSRAHNEKVTPREEKRREEEKQQLALPDWLPLEQWRAWLEVRSRVRAPNTQSALRLALGRLTKLREAGHDARTILESATLKGWKGLFPVKPEEIEQMKAKTPLYLRACAYCGKPQTGNVNHIPHCAEHSRNAMDHDPYPKEKET